MKTVKYKLPQSLVVEPEAHRRLKSDIMLAFASGVLRGMSYRPTGLNSLWSLVGAVASLDLPFAFQIQQSISEPGIMGGFNRDAFHLFGPKSKYAIELFTPSPMDFTGSQKVTIEDEGHETFFWVPDRASMTFEHLVKVGNSVLLGKKSHFLSSVGQRYANWQSEKYSP